MPHELNSLVLNNQQHLLKLLCQTAANTLLKFAHDEKYLGGTPFLMTVLHTWTQELKYHPHVHCLISAGALSEDNKCWLEPKNKNFLFPIHALAKVFRGAFLAGLGKLINTGEVTLNKQYHHTFGVSEFFSQLPEKWNVYCQPPYKNKDVAIKYFAQYTNRSGITESRITNVTETEIFIKPKRDNGEIDANKEKKLITLPLIEFFKRFFLHILPKGFHRIRYYGLSSPRCSKEKIALVEELIGKKISKKDSMVNSKPNPPCSKCHSLKTRTICLRNNTRRERIDTS